MEITVCYRGVFGTWIPFMHFKRKEIKEAKDCLQRMVAQNALKSDWCVKRGRKIIIKATYSGETQMRTKYLITIKSLNTLPVSMEMNVSQSDVNVFYAHDMGDNLNNFDNVPTFGCGKGARNPREAVIRLIQDHGYSLIAMQPA